MKRRVFLLGAAALATASTTVARAAFNAMPDISVRYIVKVLEDKTHLMPSGSIVAFLGNSLPKGWLPCDGRSLSRALYPDLFNVMGRAYTPRHWWQRLFGPRFNLPDLRAHAFTSRVG